jgi:hypothetical protein
MWTQASPNCASCPGAVDAKPRRMATPSGTEWWPSRPASASATWTAGSPANLASLTPSPALSPRPVRACACGRVYMPDGRSLDDPHFACKLAWLTAPKDALAVEATTLRAFRPAGTSTSRPPMTTSGTRAAFTGSTHVSAEEWEALAGLLRLGLTDVRPARSTARSRSPAGATGRGCSIAGWDKD